MKARCGRAVGIDLSETFLNHARKRHGAACEFGQGSAKELPFPNATFDAVRIDRSLQHIDGPSQVVREMARVAKPGGVVLCAEPDWGTFLIGGPYSEITERIQREWIGRFRNPWIGRELSTLLADAGVVDIRWEGHWLSTLGFEESELLFGIEATARELSGEIPDVLNWLDSYRQSEAYAGVLLLICWGRRSSA
jgi:SAM-dependent methyltransferase